MAQKKQMADCKTSVVDVDQKSTCCIAKQAATFYKP